MSVCALLIKIKMTHPTRRGLRPMCSQATREDEIEMMRRTNLSHVKEEQEDVERQDKRDDCDQEWICESCDFEEVLDMCQYQF